MASGDGAADTRSVQMIEKNITLIRGRPSLFGVMSDSQWSTQGKCWLTKIHYYVKTIRAQKRKMSTWEEYCWVKKLKSCQSRPLEYYGQPC